MSTQLALVESLWLDEVHPEWILDSLMGEGASNRKLRLLAAAYCRRSWNLLNDERSRAAVQAAEDYADGKIKPGILVTRQAAAESAAAVLPRSAPSSRMAIAVALLAGSAPHRHTARPGMPRISMSGRRWGRRNGVFDILAVVEALGTADATDRAGYYHLLRDIFGDPFRPVALGPLSRTPTVVSLAQAAYDGRLHPTGELDGARLAVLADALEGAGAARELVGHLRAPGSHVLGCWAVDLVLAKG